MNLQLLYVNVFPGCRLNRNCFADSLSADGLLGLCPCGIWRTTTGGVVDVF
jgi:hypothetical protein